MEKKTNNEEKKNSPSHCYACDKFCGRDYCAYHPDRGEES